MDNRVGSARILQILSNAHISSDVPNRTMQDSDRHIDRIARSTISVLISGEIGVGKEALAERIHGLSPRADKTFLRLHCASMAEMLLERELFGHEQGAFSGALQTRPGLLETADKGTVFLGEIGELPLCIQAKLLRVLEHCQILRVGALGPRPIDVRFIAATSRNLEREIAHGRFRRDLYYRLEGAPIFIPPLRERIDEIEGLARAFIDQECRRGGRSLVPELSASALALLQGYEWPGNIRELRNMVERAVALCMGTIITPAHLPMDKLSANRSARNTAVLERPVQDHRPGPDKAARPVEADASEPRGVRLELQILERERIVSALRTCAGNQTRAAGLLGMSRRTLVSRLDAYEIERPRKPR